MQINNKLQKRRYQSIVFSIAFVVLLAGCSEPSEKPGNETKINERLIVRANGELASSDTILISPPSVKFQWQYKITFLIPEGTKVEKDQPIVSFDSSQLRQKLAIKKSELKTAEKSFENTKLTSQAAHEKQKLALAEATKNQDKSKLKWEQSKSLEGELAVKKLLADYQIGKNEVQRSFKILQKSSESSSTKLAIEESKVKRLQSEVTALESGIKRMTIKASKSGIIMYRGDYQGNKVSIGDTVWMGRQLIEIPSLDKMIVKAKILENDAGKLKLDQTVEVVLDALPERAFSGKISSLGKVFRRKSREQANIILDAEVSLDELDTELMRPGMAARLKIIIGKNR